MDNKSWLKIIAAFGILAFVLIVLGVTFVPRIFASSSNAADVADPAAVVRANYTNEGYPRSINSQQSYVGSDWIERHPVLVTHAAYYSGSDWIDRHPSLYLANSDYAERHP